MKQIILQKDSEGFIRLAEPIHTSNAQTEAIIEAIYVSTGINLQLKQLSDTFANYDRNSGIKGQRGLMRRWSDEERLYVLLHHEDGDEAVGQVLGRSFMSVYMDKSKLLSRFIAWQNSEEGSQYRNDTRECQAKAFLGIKQ
jgi:hypothetical protein